MVLQNSVALKINDENVLNFTYRLTSYTAYRSVHLTSHFLQGNRKTQSCLSGRVVSVLAQKRISEICVMNVYLQYSRSCQICKDGKTQMKYKKPNMYIRVAQKKKIL